MCCWEGGEGEEDSVSCGNVGGRMFGGFGGGGERGKRSERFYYWLILGEKKGGGRGTKVVAVDMGEFIGGGGV